MGYLMIKYSIPKGSLMLNYNLSKGVSYAKI